MFRLVLIHQLVLSLLVGPLLCCCATARLGGESTVASRTASSDVKTSKHCCGKQKSSSDSPSSPSEKPSHPEKCPCKDAPAKAVAVPEAPTASADMLTLLNAALASLQLPVTLDLSHGADRSAPRFDHRSSSLSTADLLFAHHNLRC